MKATIKVIIEIDGKEHEITEAQARALHTELDKLFPKQNQWPPRPHYAERHLNPVFPNDVWCQTRADDLTATIKI